MRRCNCCGRVAVVLLKPGKDYGRFEPTVVCHRCDLVGAWPNTKRALRRHR